MQVEIVTLALGFEDFRLICSHTRKLALIQYTISLVCDSLRSFTFLEMDGNLLSRLRVPQALQFEETMPYARSFCAYSEQDVMRLSR